MEFFVKLGISFEGFFKISLSRGERISSSNKKKLKN